MNPRSRQFRALVYLYMDVLKVLNIEQKMIQLRYVKTKETLFEECISRDGQQTSRVYTVDNLEELKQRINLLEHALSQQRQRRYTRYMPLAHYLYNSQPNGDSAREEH